MNDDLHTLFKTESDKLLIVPPPSRAILAGRRRRQLLVRSAIAAPAVAVIAVGGGFLVAGGPRPVSDRGVDSAKSVPTSSSTPGAAAGSDLVASPPEQTPSCDGGGLTVHFVDWPTTRSASTALQAVEQLLGRPLPDAATDEVSMTRTDVVVPAADGHVRAVVTVRLGDDGSWRPMSVYSCPTDSLRFAD